MRVALVVPSFPKLSETFIVRKFLGLLDRGWDVHVVCGTICSSDWGRFPCLCQRADVRRRVHGLWPSKPKWMAVSLLPLATTISFVRRPASTARYVTVGWRHFGADILRRLYIDQHLVRLRPDIVHFEFGALAVGRMYLKELLTCKIVVSFRGYDLNFSGLEQPDFYREVWEKADTLHFLGRDLWRRALRRGCPPDKSHVLIPPAVETSSFCPPDRNHLEVVGRPDRPLRILSVGRLEWKKGYEYALQAVAMLKNAGLRVQYRIAGMGEYLEAVAFCRHQLGLDGDIELLGAVPHSEVPKYMAWADVFLNSSVSEGFCNAVLEAQAMKLPIVCTDADGLPENVVHGETGFVVPRRDPQALADRLMLLARDPYLRREMGRAGRRRVETHFRIDTQISAFEQLYRSLLSCQHICGPTAGGNYAH